MAYARVWDNAAPSGAAAANTIDTIFNQFREDTQQRLSSILAAGTDINTSPLLITPAAIVDTTVDKTYTPFIGITTGVGTSVIGLQGANGMAHLIATGNGFTPGTFDVSAVVPVPINAQVTALSFIGYRFSGTGTTNVRVYTMDLATGVQTLILTLGALSSIYSSISGPIAPTVIGLNTLLIVRVNGTSSTNVSTVEVAAAAVQVKYNVLAGTWRP